MALSCACAVLAATRLTPIEAAQAPAAADRPLGAVSGLDAAAVALRSRQAMAALDRYLETWNSRDPVIWATSLHFPHVRPGPGAFELFNTPEAYAASVNFAQTLGTGWHHSEWVSREVVQVGVDKVHVAGSWERYTEDGRPQTSSAILYVVTNHDGRWAIQSRLAAGTGTIDPQTASRNGSAALAALNAFMDAWNAHDPKRLAESIHYPHVRLADNLVEVWHSAEQYLNGPEPGRQRTWYRTQLDRAKVIQTTANGVNIQVTFSRLGRDGRILTEDEGIFLATLRDGAWKIQARSTMGT